MSKDFKASYKQAYDRVTPSPELLAELTRMSETDTSGSRSGKVPALYLKNLAVCCCLLLIFSVTALPVMAGNIPAVYEILANVAPSLLDFVLPTQIEATSQDITLQVEAIHIENNTAEILISFSDAADSTQDLIKGKVDLYDSYHLESLDAESVIGGCHFVEYDPATDKAYFKIDITTDGSFDKSKVHFQVHQLLVNCSKATQTIDLNNIVTNPPTKAVNGNTDDPRPGMAVLNLQATDASMANALTITGIGYKDGFLRIQTCRGSFADADRHARFYYLDETGTEKYCDASFDWHETVNEQTISFNEAWFSIEESKLKDLQMFGTFYVTDGNVKGDWDVLFSIE